MYANINKITSKQKPKTYISNGLLGDGLGSQFQHIISVLLIAMKENCEFIYNPIQRIQHNYDNDPLYIQKVEELMNIRPFFDNIEEGNKNLPDDLIYCDMDAKYYIDKNIDAYATTEAMTEVRNMFWENKIKYKTEKKEHKIVAAHIRRINEIDKTLPYLEPERFTTTYDYYINIMKKILQEHVLCEKTKEDVLEFHIYSQGNIEDFDDFLCIPNLILHINENVFSTFIDLVQADILITSFSSFSYTAALLNENTIYYHKFWHEPMKHWKQI